MANLRPFHALRPPKDRVLRVASPPYDVMNTKQARALAAGDANGFLHVSRPEIDLPEGVDEHSDEVYAQGRRNLLAMVEQGLLVRDQEPLLYIYAQRMGDHRQVGVVACASVDDYLNDRIKKHEKTRPDKEDDRTRHIATLEAHDEPVFLTYEQNDAVDSFVNQAIEAPPVYDFTTQDEVQHQLWVLDREQSLSLSKQFEDSVGDLYVADGHHRSAAAARVHQQQQGDGGEHDVFLVVVFPHDQMNILAYNRVVKDREGRTAEQLLDALRERMDVVSSDSPPPETTGEFGVYTGGQWYRATAMPGSFDANDPVAQLDCSICQDQILAPIFGITDPRRDTSIAFVGGIVGAKELERRVDSGEASIAFYLFPTRMAQVMGVSDAGLSMPPKSTWFEPNLRSGLFVHTF